MRIALLPRLCSLVHFSRWDFLPRTSCWSFRFRVPFLVGSLFDDPWVLPWIKTLAIDHSHATYIVPSLQNPDSQSWSTDAGTTRPRRTWKPWGYLYYHLPRQTYTSKRRLECDRMGHGILERSWGLPKERNIPYPSRSSEPIPLLKPRCDASWQPEAELKPSWLTCVINKLLVSFYSHIEAMSAC